MGMAASQARLLCITARIHDVEYQAQSIQNAKTQLATLSDRAYQDYLEALDATTLTLNTINSAGEKSLITANFNTLCSRNRVTAANGKEYAIRDKNGKLLVENDIFNSYEKYKADGHPMDPYMFALLMVEGDDGARMNGGNQKNKTRQQAAIENAEKIVCQDLIKAGNTNLQGLHDSILTILQKAADKYGQKVTVNSIYDSEIAEHCGDSEIQRQYREAMGAYKSELYRLSAPEILAASDGGLVSGEGSYEQDPVVTNFNYDDFNYYVSIFKQIQAAGGCRPISDYNGLGGDAANNAEWLQAMIQCGELTIDIVEADKRTGLIILDPTSPSSDSALSYTPTTEIDKKALVKAEAKYEKSLKDIDKKDKQYDLTLSKLETERSALTTQYESVKKVIEENIERTFGIFS